ncbi:carbohydrate ABC transporter permease [Paenibacillus sp. SYP-B4298]|uniref:carbohydrate ABC transporter permease n=1 Tax=Paenibacillus sp. SYP-B4298 TaxID=2996034 RepID=UPI0022DD5381|nr:carbohydrate ABC transporter permease [Paenibacillus sp. SYP-B4298]
MSKPNSTRLISDLELRQRPVKLLYGMLFLLMIAVTLICLLPPIWIIISSFKDLKEFYQVPPTLIPRTFQLDKLARTWQEFSFMQYYMNTMLVTLGTLFFTVTFNGLAGYFFSKLKPKGSALLFVLVLWTILLPNTVGLVPLYSNLVDFPILHLNLTNTYWPLWFMAAANPVTILIFKNFFDAIPDSLLEAAHIDGSTKMGIFFRIIVPLSGPVIVTVIILAVNGVWNDFFWPFMLLKEQHMWTVIVAIYNLKTSLPQDIQFIGLTFAIVPPVLLFIVFQRYIMQGATLSGSVKG